MMLKKGTLARRAKTPAQQSRRGGLQQALATATVALTLVLGGALAPPEALASGATVTFDANGGIGTMSPQVGSTEAELSLNQFTRENYRFARWTTERGGTGTSYLDGATYRFEADVTLYAQWVADAFVVTFNANGGSGAMEEQLSKTQTNLRQNSFTRANRTFLGWNTDKFGNGDAYDDGASFPFGLSGSQILYAQWSDAPPQTVIFDANRGSGSMANQTSSEPAPLRQNVFERANFTFTGWNTAANGSGTPYLDGEEYLFESGVTLFAQWAPIQTFSVTFNANGGSGAMSTQTSSTPAPLTANTFTRTSQVFMGWATTAGGSVAYANGAEFDFTQDITLYAVWSTAVTITFSPNAPDATGSMATQLLGANMILRSNAFAREGYVFSHWTTVANGTGTSYPDGWSGSLLSGNQTFYAQWVAESSGLNRVTFNANGGRGTLMAPQQSAGPANLTSNSFTAPSGRAFFGWNTAADGSGTHYPNGSEFPFSAGSTVLYAQWGFAVTMRPNGGVLISTGVASNVIAVVMAPGEIPASPFRRTNFQFVGWTNNAATPSSTTTWHPAGEAITLTAAVTLDAQWASISAGQNAVAFVSNQGVSATNQYRVTQSATEPTNLLLSPYRRSGHTFAGWSTVRGSSTVHYPDGATFPFDSPTLLYAVWTVNRVSFDPNGGTGSLASQSSTASASLTRNNGNITRTGFTFVGWNTAPDGTGQAFAQQATFPFVNPEQTLTLYAQWEPVPAASSRVVSFSANGATSGYMTPQQSEVTAPLKPNEFVRTDHQFAGWRVCPATGALILDQEAWPFSSSQTLCAQWTPLITFDPNGGDGLSYTQAATVSTLNLDPNRFSRPGHKFLGWATTAGGNAVYTDGHRLSVTTALALFAKWQSVTADQFAVSFVPNYGTTNAISMQLSSTPAALNRALTRNGWTLLGWSRSASGGVEYRNGDTYDFVEDMTLFGVWQTNTVTFDANGGTGTMASQSSVTAATLRTNGFSREGFAFDGWATTPDGAIQYSAGSSYPFNEANRSTTLYARWVPLPTHRLVTYSSNGGSGSMAAQSIESGSEITLAPNSFARAGHVFIGWNSEADGSGSDYLDGETLTITANRTLYAQWVSSGEIESQTVSFDPNGGQGAMAPQSVLGQTALTENSFTRENHIFTGWRTEPTGGVSYADESQIFAQSNLTLYAQWLELGGNVAVAFRANGGSGRPVDPLLGVPGSEKVLPSNGFARPGYVFLGWNTDPDGGSDTRFSPGSPFALPTESGALYAEWSKVWRTVTFDANGGAGSMTPQTSDQTQNLSLNSFTRSRFTFTGWSTSPDGGGAGNSYLNGASFDFSSDLTLYAQWQQTQFTVTFDANGGSGTMTPQTSSSSAALTGNTFTRTDHRFLGWATDSLAAAPTLLNGANYPFTSDTVLYAVWERVYRVTFEANGGTGSMADQTASVATPLTLAGFTREGFTFSGWSTLSGGGGQVYGNGATFPFASDQRLYAQWTPTTYTVTFNSNGASGSMSSQVASSETQLTASSLTRAGFVFRGWSTASNATTATYSDRALFPFTANAILYAIWSPINAVTYQSNGGTGTMAESRSADPQALRTNSFSRTGYAFAGWNTRADGLGQSYSDGATFPFAQNTTLHAQWTQTTFTVTFDANEGTGVMAPQARETSGNLNRNQFTRPNFVFAGWASTDSASEPEILDQAPFPFTTDTTLYAVWLPAYTVSFAPNGGGGVTTSQQGRGDIRLASSAFFRPGFRFAGWGTDEGGTLARLQPGDVIDLQSDLTLYALWVQNSPPPQRPQNTNRPQVPPQTLPLSEASENGLNAPTPPGRVPPNLSPTGPFPGSPSVSTPPTTPNQQSSRPPVAPPSSAQPPSAVDTVDTGSGGVTPTSSGPVQLQSLEQATRSLRDLETERLPGFSPGSTLSVEVVGARTTARFVLSSVQGIDSAVVIQSLLQTAAREGASFAQVVSVAPGQKPVVQTAWNTATKRAVDEAFSQSLLDPPTWIGDVDVPPNATWITVSMEGTTYLPGSTVYLAVTSDPIVLAQAQVGPDGNVIVEGSLPLESLGTGEHRIRLVGTRAFDGIEVNEAGDVNIPEEVLASIQEFDRGTQATVIVSGTNQTGGTHKALRVVALELSKPWWTVWVVLWTGFLLALARLLGKLARRQEMIVATALLTVSSLPAIYWGWGSLATEVIWWGVSLAIILSAFLWVLPAKRPQSFSTLLNRSRTVSPRRNLLARNT